MEHGAFTPLVFTTTGSMGREGTTFYKRLADMLSHKQEKPYSVVMGWLRCRLSFTILRSSIMSLRGTRSSFGHPVNEVNLSLAFAEGQVYTFREPPLTAALFLFFCVCYMILYYVYSCLIALNVLLLKLF